MTDREIISVIFVNWQIIGKKIYWLHYAKFGKNHMCNSRFEFECAQFFFYTGILTDGLEPSKNGRH